MKRISSAAAVRALLNRYRAATCGPTRRVAAKSDSREQPAGLFDLSRLPRMIGLTALAIFLVWEVGTHSVVAYLAENAPETAARLRPQEPVAVLNLAEQELGRLRPSAGTRTKQAERPRGSLRESADPSDKPSTLEGPDRTRHTGFDQRIRRRIESVLLHDPLNAKALRLLGQIASEEYSAETALKFMRASARLSIHESLAVYWAMQDSVEKRDYQAALRYADALLRTRPSLMRHVAPTLAKLAESNESSGAIRELLYNNPPWRPQFFEALIESITDARTPLDLLLSLRDSPNPASPAELKPYIEFLIMRKLYSYSYYTWLQFLTPAQLQNAGSIFNGSFEYTPSGLPFDWTITSGSGVSVDIAPISEKSGEHALVIEFQHGRVDYRSITQMTVLAPGRYRFSGKYKADLAGSRGLKWRIDCADGKDQIIGESDMIIGTVPSWNDVSFQFAVPEVDCPAQHVRLDLDARTASERLIAGSVWFDELQIERSDDDHGN